MGLALRRGHRRGPRRPARRRRRRRSPRPSRPSAGARPARAVEVLIPDCKGDADALDAIFDARPDVLNHNLETVARLQRAVRPSAGYARSLAVLARAKAAGLVTKSGLILGMGETDDEVRRRAGRPARRRRRHRHHRPVPAAHRRPPAGRPLVDARGVRRAAPRSARRWASRHVEASARSPGRATTPARPPARGRPAQRAQPSEASGRLYAMHDAPIATGRRRPAAQSVDEAYRRLRPAMVRLAHLLTGSLDLAEDVVHDAFVACAGGGRRWRPRTPTCAGGGQPGRSRLRRVGPGARQGRPLRPGAPSPWGSRRWTRPGTPCAACPTASAWRWCCGSTRTCRGRHRPAARLPAGDRQVPDPPGPGPGERGGPAVDDPPDPHPPRRRGRAAVPAPAGRGRGHPRPRPAGPVARAPARLAPVTDLRRPPGDAAQPPPAGCRRGRGRPPGPAVPGACAGALGGAAGRTAARLAFRGTRRRPGSGAGLAAGDLAEGGKQLASARSPAPVPCPAVRRRDALADGGAVPPRGMLADDRRSRASRRPPACSRRWRTGWRPLFGGRRPARGARLAEEQGGRRRGRRARGGAPGATAGPSSS